MAGNRRSGRKRLPTAVKRTRGSRIRNVSGEPTAPAGVPLRPLHLDAAAAAAWDVMAQRLLAQRVLTTAHSELLALLADGWAQYVRLQKEFGEHKYKSLLKQEWTDSEGNERMRWIENPLCRQIRQQALLLNTLLGEFGQTPASAPKVHAGSEGADPLESFLSKGATVLPFAR